jgi:hypothetical protein
MSRFHGDWVCCPKCESDEWIDVYLLIPARITDAGELAFKPGEGAGVEDQTVTQCWVCGHKGAYLEFRTKSAEGDHHG